MNRQQFLYHSSVLLAGTLFGCNNASNKTAANERQVATFDLHTHPGVFFRKGETDYPGDQAFLDRVKEMKAHGMMAAFFSLVSDWPLLEVTEKGVVPRGGFENDEGWAVFETQMNTLKGLISQSEANIALSAEELDQGEHVKAYIACEGGDFLGGKIERVDQAYEQGVRSVQLVHYAPNELGDLQTWEAQHDGLSDLGKKVVNKMNELGMLIDVAHASEKTVRDVVGITSDPIILSHSILKANNGSPVADRAITEAHAKLIADNGGLIGMWPSGFSASLEEFVEHTLRMVDVVGVDHVGIGTDMDANFQPVVNNYKEYTDWKTALREKGLSQKEVDKIGGGNAQRVLELVL